MHISLTLIIVIITVLVSIQAFNNSNIMDKLIFDPYLINRRKEWHRFITSGFLHADWIHLGLNMYMLYVFGSRVEFYYRHFMPANGFFMYVLLYLSSIVASDAMSYYKHRDNPLYRALGASGAVSAVLFTAILFEPTMKFSFGIPAFGWAIIYLVYSQYAARQNRDNIGHEAHFYGAIYGVVFTLVIKPSVFKYFLGQF